ncbi:hypothetical protein [Polynucleobacter sp. MWH-UH35A]|uniref:hypothetical protein n=1 Tax=Polynucleobacter sp. MWH-UH35A TaxID=1855619 RepID=UPI001BFEC8D0|nr:hypothetical protein [Polynucleobacter sp. MWH-UH35A]QWD59546.1 hypothetical protein ICV36_06965 [Polynucleobacter sp. MWH-UH35A]
MLDDQKKKLIEAEEKYRHQIAQKLKSEAASVEQNVANLEKTVWDKTFEILNSSFGLWLLSSVFLSGGAALYQITSHHYAQKLSTQKDFLTCEFEIENRLNAMSYLVKKAKTIGDAQYALTPMGKSFGAVSPEYEHVNITGLYFRTYQLTGVNNKKSEEYIKQLEELNLDIQKANPKAPLDDATRAQLLKVIDILKQHSINLIETGKPTLNF